MNRIFPGDKIECIEDGADDKNHPLATKGNKYTCVAIGLLLHGDPPCPTHGVDGCCGLWVQLKEFPSALDLNDDGVPIQAMLIYCAERFSVSESMSEDVG